MRESVTKRRCTTKSHGHFGGSKIYPSLIGKSQKTIGISEALMYKRWFRFARWSMRKRIASKMSSSVLFQVRDLNKSFVTVKESDWYQWIICNTYFLSFSIQVCAMFLLLRSYSAQEYLTPMYEYAENEVERESHHGYKSGTVTRMGKSILRQFNFCSFYLDYSYGSSYYPSYNHGYGGEVLPNLLTLKLKHAQWFIVYMNF